jgi:hypothetical protein
MKAKKLLKGVLLLVAVIGLSSWGQQGHYKISYCSALSFNSQMNQFLPWAQLLADHASDADARKSTDPNEAPKHYIDIDNYSEFISTGTIPQSYAVIVGEYGQSVVVNNGIIPWATKTTYDSLKSCFIRKDWNQAMLYASDLGHYVGDGHMPLHITANYNGQMTGNSGIHSRYESTMIDTYLSQISYAGEDISFISNVDQYIFDYLYASYQYKDSVLAADNYAKNLSGGSHNTVYYDALWLKTKNFTINLFKESSHSLAELIYTAWVEAGSPSMVTFVQDRLKSQKLSLNVSPNPCQKEMRIDYTIPYNSNVLIQIKNIQGETVGVISNEYQNNGSFTKTWSSENQKSGIYFLVISTENEVKTESVLLIK